MDTLLAVNIGEQWCLGSGLCIGQAPQFESPGTLISTLLPNVYVAAGILLFLLLIFGGFSIIMGAGQNDPKKVGQGQKAATAAVIGFLVIFASYWIIQVIEKLTGLEILNPTF